MSKWVDVAKVEDFPAGGCKVVPTDDMPVAVINLGGAFYAIDNICTHEYAELSDGHVEGEEIVCPWHGARFSVRTGLVTSPPAYENLNTYPVQVIGGMVQVDIENIGNG